MILIDCWTGKTEDKPEKHIAATIRYFLHYYGPELETVLRSVSERSYAYYRAVELKENEIQNI